MRSKSYLKIGDCEIEIAKPCGFIIIGASGDLAKRKLIPALYRLNTNRLMPDNFFILGTGRTEMTTARFRDDMMTGAKKTLQDEFDSSLWMEFSDRLYYSSVNYTEIESYIGSIGEILPSLEQKHRTMGNRIFYLAIPPSLFEPVIENLGSAGLSKVVATRNREDSGFTHIVIEKPFGRDLDSAKSLNSALNKWFKENQIFRIDHYLAKETVQSILMFRFANSIFEPIWNRRYIDHVQITAAETIGVEQRAGYYEQTGVLRDMFQNHMFQLLALTAMEPPVAFEADRVRDEKLRVFRSIRPFPLDRLNEFTVVGQYGKGVIDETPVAGYREEPGVSEKSNTPTFAVMKVLIDNWRWNEVPFYLRSGKRLSKRKTEISIHFKRVPHLMFAKSAMEVPIEPNILLLRVQPDEGINLFFQTKKPGAKICLNSVSMDFSYKVDVELEAYEWVLLDCMLGDHILSLREDEVEQTWALLTPVINNLESAATAEKFPNYEAGSSGPEEAARLIERDGRMWRPL